MPSTKKIDGGAAVLIGQWARRCGNRPVGHKGRQDGPLRGSSARLAADEITGRSKREAAPFSFSDQMFTPLPLTPPRGHKELEHFRTPVTMLSQPLTNA